MTDRPILYTDAMVVAQQEGRKTQTRRILKLPKWSTGNPDHLELDDDGSPMIIASETGCLASIPVRFAKGDRLWVREGWAQPTDQPLIVYRADYPACVPKGYENVPPKNEVRWKVSIHMPRSASRITDIVTDVRVQRLCDISREDAAAEGLIRLKATGRYVLAPGTQYLGFASHDPRAVYAYLWDTINGEGSWAKNPWVVAVTFTVHKINIDKMKDAA